MSNIYTRTRDAAILAVALSPCFAPAQTAPSEPGGAPPEAWHSDSVVYVAGLDDLKHNARGSLRIAPDDLIFLSGDFQGPSHSSTRRSPQAPMGLRSSIPRRCSNTN